VRPLPRSPPFLVTGCWSPVTDPLTAGGREGSLFVAGSRSQVAGSSGRRNGDFDVIESAATAAHAAPKPRILLVEDEPLVGMLLDEDLGELGFAVVGPVADVVSAVDVAGSADFEAAIIDLRLGQANAYPVAETLAARGIPFALTSGLPH